MICQHHSARVRYNQHAVEIIDIVLQRRNALFFTDPRNGAFEIPDVVTRGVAFGV